MSATVAGGTQIPQCTRYMSKPPRLRRAFFDRSVHEVAPELIGATLLFDGVGGMIVEVEVYHHTDPAAHSDRGPTPRNAVLFGPPGVAYVYSSYGSHWCLSFVCEQEGSSCVDLLGTGQARRGATRQRQAQRPAARSRAIRIARAPGQTRDRHWPAHRHQQGGRAPLALRAEGVAVLKQAVPLRRASPTRPLRSA